MGYTVDVKQAPQMSQYDYVVIGGGFNGASTAYHLATHKDNLGKSVLLIDQGPRQRPYGGIQGRSQVTALTSLEFKSRFETIAISNRIFKEFEKHGYQLYTPMSHVTLIEEKDPAISAIDKECSRRGANYRMYRKDNIKNDPALDDVNTACQFVIIEKPSKSNRCGLMDPTALRNAFIFEGEEHKLETLFDTKVVSCKSTETGKKWQITLNNGKIIEANKIALLTGAYKTLLPELKRDTFAERIPMFYVPLKPKSKLNASYVCLTKAGNIDLFAITEIYEGKKCLRVGMQDVTALKDTSLNDQEFRNKVWKHLAPKISRIFSQHLEGIQKIAETTCTFDGIERGYPFIGKEMYQNNEVFLAKGLGGNSAKHSGFTGRHLAEYMTTGEPSKLVKEFGATQSKL